MGHYTQFYKWQSRIVGGAVFSFCIRYVYSKLRRRIYNLPPGPEGVPIFGTFLSAIIYANTFHIDLSTVYGPIVYYSIVGSGPTVLINDSKIIKKQILNRSDDIGIDRNESIFCKPNFFMLWAAKDNTIPFVFLNGKRWFDARKRFHNSLVTMLDTKHVNHMLSESINTLLAPELASVIDHQNGVWYSRDILAKLTFYAVFQANFGHTSLQNDIFKQLADDFQSIALPRIASKWFMTMAFPFLKYIPSYFNELVDLRARIHDNIVSMINKREREVQECERNDNVSTFLDQCRELRKRKELTIGQEVADVMMLFQAGTETTASTLEWGLALLAKQVDIQQKVRNELKRVLNENKLDSSNVLYDNELLVQLPLFRACIREILRISCVSKFGVQHYLKKGKDIWIETGENKKYRIPGGTTVYYNVDYVHNYSKTERWKNPERLKEICLENWLKLKKTEANKTEDQYAFVNNASFLTFGFGNRNCAGFTLALKEMRIIIGYLLLNYKFTLQNKAQMLRDTGGRPVGSAKLDPEIPILIQRL